MNLLGSVYAVEVKTSGDKDERRPYALVFQNTEVNGAIMLALGLIIVNGLGR